ncbi:TPA: NAD-dependent epimerase/dehydratase family protein [Legionella anisa]
MNVIIGAHSRLGRSLAQFLSFDRSILLDRKIYDEWWRKNSADKISYFFEDLHKKWRGNTSEQIPMVFVPAGVLDPNRPEREHIQVNFSLAKNIIEGAGRLGFQTVTFGTVMETLIGSQTSNPYIASKTRLGDYVTDYSVKHATALHIRLHTLYGVGLPSPFMFLGQVLHALLHQIDFKMSPGNQLREYHHIDDDVRALINLVLLKKSGVIDLSHGQPLTLKALAHYIFAAFGCLELLEVGALSEPLKDNCHQVFSRSTFLRDETFRDPFPAIVSYLRSCLQYIKESEHV